MLFRSNILLFFFFFTSSVFGQKLVLEKLPAFINSAKYDEIAPILSPDGQTMYFTRVGSPDFDKTLEVEGKDMQLSLSQSQYNSFLANIYSRIAGYPIRNAITSSYNQDVWIAQFEKNDLVNCVHPSAPLNNALPNSICALTPKNNSFIVLNQFLPGGGMDEGFSIIEKQGENWQFPTPIKIEDYYTNGSNVNITMSPDGEVLIMSLKRNDSQGGNDLYVSIKNNLGGWTAPMNMGVVLNSRASEDTPTISADKKTIYFSSNRSNTMGGRDIFRSRRNSDDWTDWTVPRRFIAPINSNKDDSQPFFNDATGYLYFSSNREGSADIYRVKVAGAKSPKVLVKGKIVNALTNELMSAKVLYGPNEMGYYQRYFKSKDGYFEIRIPKGQTFKIMGEQKDFLSPIEVIETNQKHYYPTQELTLYLTPIRENIEIKLAPIYFKQSESIILENSYAALDYLVTFLNEKSTISIRVEGHTENIGEPKDLINLSEQRAFAVKRYLLDRGIDSSRVEAIGFGASRPAVKGKKDGKRQLNRRVEVRITKVE